MAGLWIAHVNVTDEETYARYVAKATDVLSSHGGKFMARGGRYEQMEGSDHSRNVIVRFDSFEDAVQCYNSVGYQEIVDQAIGASDRSVVLVEVDV